MRKIVLALFGIVLALGLSACGDNPPSLEDRTQENIPPTGAEVTYEGLIEPLEISLYQEGTHRIITDSGEEVVAESPTVNLSDYNGKRVVAVGTLRQGARGEALIFVVGRIEGGESVGKAEYVGAKWGFSFQYPSGWQAVEGPNLVTLKDGSIEVIKVSVSNLDTDLGEFVASREVEDGTPVTVGGQKSLRYSAAGETWIYVPNDSKRKVYRISFTGEPDDESAFFDLLESFQVKAGRVTGGEKCGGIEGLQCGEGFRCELQGAEEDAEGVCVSIDGTSGSVDCPFVPKPENCIRYEPKSVGMNGCPTSYVCVEGGAVPEEPKSEGSLSDAVLSAFQRAQGILLPSDSTIVQYEWVPEQNILDVVFVVGEGKRMSRFSYQSGDTGLEFQKLATYDEGEDRDWVLKEGQEFKVTAERTVIKVGTEGSQPKTVAADMRLYENVNRHFSIQYPKNWYFRSFGAIEGKILAVGFSDKPLEEYSKSILTFTIEAIEGTDRRGVKGDRYWIEVPRDAGSHFNLEGPLEFKDTLEKMAETLVSE